MQEKAHALYNKNWLVQQGVEARRTKQKARIERFYQLEDSLTSQQDEKLDISLQHSRLGKKIIELEHLRKTFGDKVCIADLTYAVVRNDRIGIVGNNGLGKSTLLNIIGKQMPYDSGSVTLGDTVRIGYYTQDNSDLPEDMKVIDYVREKANISTAAMAHSSLPPACWIDFYSAAPSNTPASASYPAVKSAAFTCWAY